MAVFLGVLVVGYGVPIFLAAKAKKDKLARIWIFVSTVICIGFIVSGIFFAEEFKTEKVVSFVTGNEVKLQASSNNSSSDRSSDNQIFATLLGSDMSMIDIDKAIKPSSCETDSYLISSSNNEYKGELMLDGRLDTSWQDGNPDGNAVGETITFYFDGAKEISYMVIRNGNCRSREKYAQNARVRSMIITDNNGDVSTVTLEDVYDAQVIKFDGAKKVKFISLTIDSEYEGTVYKDTCISEVSFY